MVSRKRKLLYNMGFSVGYQIVAIVSSFILPRLFIEYYGSEVNGLVSSITQFLSFITLCELGVGAVVQSSLYKPLADKNELKINEILTSSDRFFKKIAYILVVYITILLVVYPLITLKDFNYFFTAVLIIAIGINLVAQYYLGMTYRLLLNADQKIYIQLGTQMLTIILNTIISIVLIMNNFDIQIVKLSTSILFMTQPLFLKWYVNRNYNIKKVELDYEPIEQKWNGLAQHIAIVVLGNTDVIVLTLFSTLANVSIYGVYSLVINGVKKIILSLVKGITPTLGNMLAKKEYKLLYTTFKRYEFLLHTIVTLVFTTTAILIIPFIKVYTNNIADINYNKPLFGVLLTVAVASNCIRLPYITMVLAAGHYKQTQVSAIIESIINIIISIVFVKTLGLVGVAIGTLVAISYRTVYLARYLSRGTILSYEFTDFIKHIIVDMVISVCVYFTTKFFTLENISYLSWIVLAVKVFVTGAIISIIINSLVYKKQMTNIWGQIWGKKRRKEYEQP